MDFRKDFQPGATIGRGTEGSVQSCLSNFSPNCFAVKKVDLRNLLIREVHKEPSEVATLSMLVHRNVIDLYLAWSEAHVIGNQYAPGLVFVAMKICTRSLSRYLKETPETDVGASNYIFRQIIEGLAFIHENGIAHRDIKPANVLLEEDLTVKIADFGIAKAKQPPNVLNFPGGVYGRVPYRAPELFDPYARHNEMVDIFSAGMVYFELFMPGEHERKEKLRQLSKIIMKHAEDFDLLRRPAYVPGARQPGAFDLGALLSGTDVTENWLGNLTILQEMVNPEKSKRSSASKILELLDDQIADDVDDSNGIPVDVD